MTSGRATITIALRELKESFLSANGLSTVAIFLVLAAFSFSRTHASALTLCVFVAGFCNQYPIALSGDKRFRWMLLSAPLYGRELARAVAVTPTIISALLGLAFGFIMAPAGAELNWAIAGGSGAACCSMISLSTTLRAGRERFIFIWSGMLAGAGIAYIGTLGGPMTTAASVVLAAVGSYFALRAFGETFARLDLVD